MLRFGIVGTSFIADWFMDGIAHCAGIEVTAVCSRNRSSGEAFAAKYGIPNVFLSPNEMADFIGVDAFYIASPNCLHEKQSLIAIMGGKHVLVEKPAAPDFMSFSRMRDAAAQRGAILLEAMRPAHMASRKVLRTQVDRLGQIRRATLGFCQYSSRYDKFKQGIIENAFNPALSNCGLLDLGIYCVNLLVDLFGFPKSIQAVSNKLSNGFDAQGTLAIQYPYMVAEILYSKVADGRNGNEIEGEQGTLLFDAVGNPLSIRTVFRDGREEKVSFALPEDIHGMTPEIIAFADMVEKGTGQARFLDLTADSLKITDTARLIAGIDFPKIEHGEGEST